MLAIAWYLHASEARAGPDTFHRQANGMTRQPPNKRLKLTGGDRLKGSGVLCPGGARTVVHYSCADGRGARSLSAVR